MEKSLFFDKIRNATQAPEGFQPTQLPDWDATELHSSQQPDLVDSKLIWKRFEQRFTGVNGEIVKGLPSLVQFLQEQKASHGYLAPELRSKLGAALEGCNIGVETTFDESRVDDYTFGITRAAGIIAETGTVVIKESSTPSRLGALAPWIHITLVDAETRLYPTLFDAVTDLGNEPYVVFATGPSKTADVEGILIEGVHGPGRQICCRV